MCSSFLDGPKILGELLIKSYTSQRFHRAEHIDKSSLRTEQLFGRSYCQSRVPNLREIPPTRARTDLTLPAHRVQNGSMTRRQGAASEGQAVARDKIFISYRRDDAAADAQSVYQDLARRFGKRRIFMDVDSIQPGPDFRDILKASFSRTRVLLVLIGPRWNEGGRLHGENDFVRLEVREALSAGIPVVPFTLGETPLPATETLPEDLQPLIFRHKLSARYESFGSDMAAVERAL